MKRILLVGLMLTTIMTNAQNLRGNCLDFDGSNDRIEMNDWQLGSGDFTVSFWVYTHNSSGGKYIVTNRSTEFWSTGNWFVFGIANGKFLYHSGEANTGSTSGVLTNTSITLNEWQHFAITRKGDEMKMYVNGQLDNSFTEPVKNLTNSTGVSRIGDWHNATAQQNNYDGLLDEVMIWSTALGADKIRENMNLTLDGTEQNLIAYYNFNEVLSSSTLTDLAGNNNGILTLMTPATDWVTSGVNTGNSTNSLSLSLPMVALNTPSPFFNAVNADFSINSGLVEDYTVTYQEFVPNTLSGAPASELIFSNSLWTITKETPNGVTFNFLSLKIPFFPINGLPSNYHLYWREMHSELDWTYLSSGASIANDYVKFPGVNKVGQFMIVYSCKPPEPASKSNEVLNEEINEHPVNSNEIEKKITIYPNPSSNIVMVDVSDLDNVQEIAIYNSIGTILSKVSVQETRVVQFETNEIGSPGIYFVCGFDAEGNVVSTEKLIIQ